MKKSPCNGCTNRTVTCHGVCRRYQEWQDENEKVKQWLRDQAPITSENVLKAQNKRLRHGGKSRKWNLKNQYNRGES
jgi:hypothetical protein